MIPSKPTASGQTLTCYRCGEALPLPPGNVSRRETCGKCGADVRVCRNCTHYDPKAYNECREPSAERVVEKEKSNFCDYFSLGHFGTKSGGETKEDALRKLDDLFKK